MGLTRTMAALALPALIMILSGCEVLNGSKTPPEPEPATQTAKGDGKLERMKREDAAQLRKTAEQYVGDLISAMGERNYKLFIRNLTDEMKSGINEQAFNGMADEFAKKKGAYVSREYLCEMTQGYFMVFLWKARFEPPKEVVEAFKKEGKSPDEIIKSDTLVRLELAKVDGAYKVLGIYFQ